MQWCGAVILSTLNHGKTAVDLRQTDEPSHDEYCHSASPDSDDLLPVNAAASALNFVVCQTAKAGAAGNTMVKAATSRSTTILNPPIKRSRGGHTTNLPAAHMTMNTQ